MKKEITICCFCKKEMEEGQYLPVWIPYDTDKDPISCRSDLDSQKYELCLKCASKHIVNLKNEIFEDMDIWEQAERGKAFLEKYKYPIR